MILMRQSKLVLVNNNKLLHCNIEKSTCMVDIGPVRLHTARSATDRRLLFVLLSRNLRPTISCKSHIIVRFNVARGCKSHVIVRFNVVRLVARLDAVSDSNRLEKIATIKKRLITRLVVDRRLRNTYTNIILIVCHKFSRMSQVVDRTIHK